MLHSYEIKTPCIFSKQPAFFLFYAKVSNLKSLNKICLRNDTFPALEGMSFFEDVSEIMLDQAQYTYVFL